LRLVTDWGAHRAGITRLWLEIDPTNEASLPVTAQCGYRLERRLPAHCRSPAPDEAGNAQWHDSLIWSHTASCLSGGRGLATAVIRLHLGVRPPCVTICVRDEFQSPAAGLPVLAGGQF